VGFNKKTTQFKESAQGVSLVEILFAFLILSGIFISLFQVMSTSMKGTERLSEESYAANHAISLLESIAVLPYNSIPLIASETSDTELPHSLTKIPGFLLTSKPDEDFPRTIEITEESRQTKDQSDGDNSRWGSLKLISVKVSWNPDYLKKNVIKHKVFRSLVTNHTEVYQ